MMAKEYKYEKLKIPSGIDLNSVWFDTTNKNIIEKHDNFLDVMRYINADIESTIQFNELLNRPKIKNVIFHDPATIVYWTDGTRTVVKCDDDEKEFDHEKGLAMAIAKKFLGTNESQGDYYNEFKKWLPKEEEKSATSELLNALGKIMCANWFMRDKKEDENEQGIQ